MPLPLVIVSTLIRCDLIYFSLSMHAYFFFYETSWWTAADCREHHSWWYVPHQRPCIRYQCRMWTITVKKIGLLSFLTIHLNSSCSCALSVGLQILLFLHSGLSASQDRSIYPAVWGKHTHLRSKPVYPVCLLQRSGAAVWKQQPCLEHLEEHDIMRWVLCVDPPQMVHFTTPDCCCGWFFRGANLSWRPCLCGAGASLSPQLLQPQPCTARRGSRQLLCLPNKWGLPVLTFHSTHLSLSTS